MEAAGSSHRKTRRSDGPITTPLECFRQGKNSESMRNALAELAMRLVDAEDRQEFRKADGVTAILDHLGRILEEQAALDNTWSRSEVFGATWEEFEVHDSLQFTLVALCHASIDSDIAEEMHDLGALATLFQLLNSLPPQLQAYESFVLESLRNLCGTINSHDTLPTSFVQSIWELLLPDAEVDRPASLYRRELAAEILTNVAAFDPTRTAASPERLSTTLSTFLQFAATPETANFSLALADLLCNLCSDQACCLLLICELDARRPRGHLRHSGVVYLAKLTEKANNDALKQSMEALVHNLSWSDPAGKRSIQKLALSSFMHRFAS